MVFGMFRRKPIPLIQDENIQPVGKSISTAEAKRLFRETLNQLRDRMKLDRDDVSTYVEEFADEIRDHAEELADEIGTEKANIANLKRELEACRGRLEAAPAGETRDDLTDEIEDLEAELGDSEAYLAEIVSDLEEFKKNKREFLREKLNEIIGQYNEGR